MNNTSQYLLVYVKHLAEGDCGKRVEVGEEDTKIERKLFLPPRVPLSLERDS